MARRLIVNGETHTLVQLCKQYRKNYSTVENRLRDKWSIEEALGLVPRPLKKRKTRAPKVAEIPAEPPKPLRINYGPYGIPFTRAGRNIMAAAMGLLSGEEYLRAEGFRAPPRGEELRLIPRFDQDNEEETLPSAPDCRAA